MENIHLKMRSAIWQPFCFVLNVLRHGEDCSRMIWICGWRVTSELWWIDYLPCESVLRCDEIVMFSCDETIQILLWSNSYSDVIMSAMASQITRVSIVCSIVCSGAYQIKPKSSASLAFVRGIHRGTRKMFPFDDVIIIHFVLYTTHYI